MAGGLGWEFWWICFVVDYAIVWRKHLIYPQGWDFGDLFSWGNVGEVGFFEFCDGSMWGRASEGFCGILGLNS